jgi:hypothetical protein
MANQFQFSIKWLLGATAVMGLLAWVVSHYARSSREAARRTTCTSHLKFIGLAMLQYETAYGTFPPAYVAGPDGTPWHSWRTLLLPYLGPEEAAIYRQYNFKEPWDGPNNRRLASSLPDCLRSPIYHCPSDPLSGRDGTDYLLITGPGTVFEADHVSKLKEIRDGAENTIIVVEVAHSGIQWMEPRDLVFEEMDFRINGATGKSISSLHPMGAMHIRADGSVHFLNDSTTERAIRALITIDGGDHADLPAIYP